MITQKSQASKRQVVDARYCLWTSYRWDAIVHKRICVCEPESARCNTFVQRNVWKRKNFNSIASIPEISLQLLKQNSFFLIKGTLYRETAWSNKAGIQQRLLSNSGWYVGYSYGNHFPNQLAAALFTFLVNYTYYKIQKSIYFVYLNLPVKNMMVSKQLFLKMMEVLSCVFQTQWWPSAILVLETSC